MRTVLLQHTLPDGTFHYDWMLESPSDQDGLLTFRVDARIDEASCVRFEGVRLRPHRRAYLDYEGEVSGGRGEVRRIAAGDCEFADSGSRIEGIVNFGLTPRRFVGQRGQGDRWEFEFLGPA
jgi:hypothetical protein